MSHNNTAYRVLYKTLVVEQDTVEGIVSRIDFQGLSVVIQSLLKIFALKLSVTLFFESFHGLGFLDLELKKA